MLYVIFDVCVVSEVVQTLQLRDRTDAVGDLSVCLDGMSVDPEMFATAEADQHRKEPQKHKLVNYRPFIVLIVLD